MSMLSGAAQEIRLTNPSFEHPGTATIVRDWDQIGGWSSSSGANSGTLQDEYFSPVEGRWYAYQIGDADPISQETDHAISAGETYTLQLWARSINRAGNSAKTTVEARFYYDDVTIATVSAEVNAPQLKGAAATTPNDDGANVWIDGAYRHQFSDVHMVQSLTADPIDDEWTIVENSGYEAINRLGWAVGNVIAGEHRYIYGTIYRDRPGQFYMGYDFRKQPSREMDYMGVRRLYWVNDWPTIWTPITVTFKADDFPSAIGKKLGVSFRNAGHEDSKLAIDHITVQMSGNTGIDKKHEL